MSIEVKVPVLPESVSEATLLSWHKSVGDAVHRDENLVDIETEKVVLEVPAPRDGVIKELVRQNGDTVTSEELIAVIDEQDVGAAAAAPQATETAAKPQAGGADDTKLSPAARKLVAEHNLDPAAIPATGKDGRLTKEDVNKYIEQNKQAPAPQPAAPAAAPPPPPAAAPAPAAPAAEGERFERRVPMTRLRSTIAKRLKEAQNTAAMLTTFNDVNLQAVMDARNTYKDQFEKKHDVRLGMMSFFVKAAIEGLRRYPVINAYVEGNDIVYHDYYDVGIAAASPRGLVVPIIRNAEQLSFAGIEQRISELGKKARDGTLAMEELMGGTFTISNGGVFGSMLSTPILNPPQSGILGMHRIDKRPIEENGEIVIRPMMYLALSYDHRIIDGSEAVRFLVTIKECLEDPTRLLLQV